jgi:hypothetical protein
MTRHLLVALTCVASLVAEAPAQQARAAGVQRPASGVAGESAAEPRPRPRNPLLSPDSAWWVPLSSTLLPGLGQMRLGQNRFVAYLAVEGYALLGWASGEAAVRREVRTFRALARDVGRAFVDGNQAIGSWDYYEAMEKKIESGVFSRTPGLTVSPETDIETFNGDLWLKSRQLHWTNPGVEPPISSPQYQAALDYYQERAVRDNFRWSWRNAQLEWDDYRQSIRRKNDASREARHYLALVAVNHLLSTVDAFVTLRLRGGLGAPGGPAGPGGAYLLSVQFPLR